MFETKQQYSIILDRCTYLGKGFAADKYYLLDYW